MRDLIIIGAGPGGIALAAEAQASGIDPSKTLILEKWTTHNWAIRQLYPEQKVTTANYKGFQARCEGLLCIGDMTKSETIHYFDRRSCGREKRRLNHHRFQFRSSCDARHLRRLSLM